jgi:hypothetical protein
MHTAPLSVMNTGRLRVVRLAAIVAVPFFGFFGLGCATFGIANAPSANRSSRPVTQHDVTANGPESCERDGTNSDPLRYRIPACDGEHDPSAPPPVIATKTQ